MTIYQNNAISDAKASIWQIKDQYGNVRLEYLDEEKAKEICTSLNAMSRSLVYTVYELKDKE